MRPRGEQDWWIGGPRACPIGGSAVWRIYPGQFCALTICRELVRVIGEAPVPGGQVFGSDRGDGRRRPPTLQVCRSPVYWAGSPWFYLSDSPVVCSIPGGPASLWARRAKSILVKSVGRPGMQSRFPTLFEPYHTHRRFVRGNAL